MRDAAVASTIVNVLLITAFFMLLEFRHLFFIAIRFLERQVIRLVLPFNLCGWHFFYNFSAPSIFVEFATRTHVRYTLSLSIARAFTSLFFLFSRIALSCTPYTLYIYFPHKFHFTFCHWIYKLPLFDLIFFGERK